MTTDNYLKSCPDCDSDATLFEVWDRPGVWRVVCNNHCYTKITGMKDNRRSAINEWNSMTKYSHVMEYRLCVPGLGAMT